LHAELLYFGVPHRHVIFLKKHQDKIMEQGQSAGLLKPSAIKSAVSTIEQRLVLKLLGKLSARDLPTLEKALKGLFDLNRAE